MRWFSNESLSMESESTARFGYIKLYWSVKVNSCYFSISRLYLKSHKITLKQFYTFGVNYSDIFFYVSQAKTESLIFPHNKKNNNFYWLYKLTTVVRRDFVQTIQTLILYSHLNLKHTAIRLHKHLLMDVVFFFNVS